MLNLSMLSARATRPDFNASPLPPQPLGAAKDLAGVKESRPLPDDAVRKQAEDSAQQAKLAPQNDTWGYRAQLLTTGDTSRLEAFHARLASYLATTALVPNAPEAAAVREVSLKV